MSPPFPSENNVCVRGCYTKPSTNIRCVVFASGIHSVSFGNFSISKHCAGVKLPLILKLPSLLVHFSRVISMGSEVKMFWVTAGPASNAVVKNANSTRRVLSSMNNPRNTMSVICSLASEFLRKAKLAISVILYVAKPRPAFVWFPNFNVRPKKSLVVLREKLPKMLWGYSLSSHNISCLLCLLCHAPGLVSAGALSFLSKTTWQRN